jgi:DNA adenine methylase
MNLHPFLKWAGGKTQLLPELLKRIPPSWNRETDLYVEPFLGGGALFWELQPKNAVLGVASEELYIAWLGLDTLYVDDTFENLCRLRDRYARLPEATYYAIRESEPAAGAIGTRAARTIFLNKTCFNGLYRVNSKGGFNVPWGQNPAATVFDEENLSACANFLRDNQPDLNHRDFESLPCSGVSGGVRGAFIYCDPPYVPVSKTSNFTSYTAGGFTYADQLRLAVWAAKLRDAGAHVMLSQAADEILIDQYRRLGFKCDKVAARRNINSKGAKRGPVGEYIIY